MLHATKSPNTREDCQPGGQECPGSFHAERLAARHRWPPLFPGTAHPGNAGAVPRTFAAPTRPNRVHPRAPVPQREPIRQERAAVRFGVVPGRLRFGRPAGPVLPSGPIRDRWRRRAVQESLPIRPAVPSPVETAEPCSGGRPTDGPRAGAGAHLDAAARPRGALGTHFGKRAREEEVYAAGNRSPFRERDGPRTTAAPGAEAPVRRG